MGGEENTFNAFENTIPAIRGKKRNLRTIAEGSCPELNGRKKLLSRSIERKRSSGSQNEGNHTGEAVETGPAIQLQ